MDQRKLERPQLRLAYAGLTNRLPYLTHATARQLADEAPPANFVTS